MGLVRRGARSGWAAWGRHAAGIVSVLVLVGCTGGGQPPAANQTGQLCGLPPWLTSPSPPVVTGGIAVYKARGVAGIEKLVAGPDGNLWFIGLSDVLNEVVGRMTPGGSFTLYPLNTGASFDGIASGPDGNIWFTEAAALKIGRLVPSTGQISDFAVPVPPSPPSASPPNTQATDIVAGPDGALWFDVQQIAMDAVRTGYVGRITTAGVVSLFAVPGGDQPIGIQAGADGNMWARIAVSGASQASCVLPGYTPTSTVARVKDGRVTEVSEDSPAFAGYAIGPDGNHWWMTSSGRLRRTTPDGQVKEFPARTNLGFWDAFRFVFGPDGNIWYSDGTNVLSMTPNGIVTTYVPPGPNSGATWITLGPNGKVWFVEGASGAATIGAIKPGS
jgi:streptogramin lyase